MIQLRAARCAVFCLAAVAAAIQANAQNPAVNISVNATMNRKPINPNIYGVAYGTSAQLADLNVPLSRYGGDNASRYNWKLNADNRGNDWFFESIADASAVAGERGDSFIAVAKAANAQPMVTIPMIDWIANLGANRTKLASFNTAKYGAQQKVDPYWTSAGNGIKSTGAYISGNNPADANVANSPAFQQGWVQALLAKWGGAANGGLKYYILDNEPGIWHATHRDVHPVGVTMDELRSKTIAYASAVKAVDPSALVVGPEEWGWTNYLYSGYDSQYGSKHGWGYLPDRAAHNNMDIMPWLLDQLRQYEATNGKRLLDVFSLHYYPQGGEYTGGVDTTTQLLRNRSTRSLWDPTYVDQSWINTVVQLIPRMHNWVNTYYPGTTIGITEYNWGAEGYINGATAQADIWGIFGREGLDMAARWTAPGASTPTYKAMKLYRNYDGKMSGFGDTSVYAGVPNPDNLSSFASIRSSDGALTVMVVNKVLSGNTPFTVNLANFTGNGVSQVWQVTAANSINRLADVAANGSVSLTVPPQSITLLVLPIGATTPPSAPANLAAYGRDSKVYLSWQASGGESSFTIKRSTVSGGPYTTISSSATSPSFADTGVTNGTTYYYTVSGTSVSGNSPDSNEASATPLAGSGPQVQFIKSDTTTAGTWKGEYGGDGYSIAELIGGASLPTYAQWSLSGKADYVWAASTTDVRALQKVSTSDRIAACWYGAVFTAHLNLTDGNPHQVALYMLDWDTSARAATIDVLDTQTGAALNTQPVTSYHGGKWLVWSVSGDVTFRFTNTAGNNAVLSGLFLGPASVITPTAPAAPTGLSASPGNAQVTLSWSAASGATSYNVKRSTSTGTGYVTVKTGLTTTTYTDTPLTNGTKYFYVVSASNSVGESGNSNEASATPTAPSGGASATFIKTDTTTQGSWKGVYGADGYSIAQLSGGTSLPAFAQWSLTGISNYAWASSTTDVRALQKVSTTDRIAACWYGATFTANLNLTDGLAHQVALYLLDWDTTARAVKVDVLDASTGAVLDTQSVSSYHNGKWLVWSVTGNVKFRFTSTAGYNAVLSGVCFR